MHYWGDESVDWDGINDAAEFIGGYLRRYGRVPVRDFKEKYGSVRVYLSLGWDTMHDITHPGHCYRRYPQWLWRINCRYTRWFIHPISRWIVLPYHKWLYRRAYRLACDRWPHLRREILCACDFPELLTGLYGHGYHLVDGECWWTDEKGGKY